MKVQFSVQAWSVPFLAALGVSSACSSTADVSDGASGGGGGSDDNPHASAGQAGAPLDAPRDPSSAPCEDPEPVELPFGPTNRVRCTNGGEHRPTANRCPTLLPRDAPIDPEEAGIAAEDLGCTRDSDCEGDNAYCYVETPEFYPAHSYCRTGCVEDADCREDQVCACQSPVGECVDASCKTDADCGSDSLCVSISETYGCGNIRWPFACLTREDECRTYTDCPDGVYPYCATRSGVRVCEELGAACGRPFLVAGSPRLASIEARDDWLLAPLEHGARSELDPELRAAAARHWLEMARLEHASIAAFARFTLQLLSLGAPSHLVEGAARASQDELRHAKLCYSLAARFGKPNSGPGPLPMDSALDETSAREIMELVVVEGCVGETVAAVAASAALETARDPEVRAALECIAHDEREHALLAWKSVAWALERWGDALRGPIARAFERACEAQSEPCLPFERQLAAHGLLMGTMLGELRSDTLRSVVRPAASQLLSSSKCSTKAAAKAAPLASPA